MCKQHSHLCFAGFSRNIALVHWILHCLAWILHMKKGGCKLKSALHMAQEYCLLEGAPYHLEEGGFLLKGILHFSEDSSIVFRGIEKHCTFSKEECNWMKHCFFTNRGHFIVAFNNILHFRTGMHYHVKVMLNIMDTCFPSREGSISLFRPPASFRQKTWYFARDRGRVQATIFMISRRTYI